MSRELIDQVLVAWEERLRRVDENLLALEAEPTYQMLTGTDGRRAPLDGATKARVAPALDALGELFEHRERLTEVLERAKEVRESISSLTFWNTDEKLLEVEKLLHGPSIKLGTKATPLAQRNLLDPAALDVAVVPEQLLQAMVQAYDSARGAVMDVQRAWSALEPAIERAEAEVSSLRSASAALGVDQAIASELASVERELAGLRQRVARDPLGVSGAIDGALAPRLAALRQRLDALGSLRDRVTSELARAATLRRRLDEVHAAAKRALATARGEIVEAAKLALPNDDEALRGLDPWLEKLELTARAGRWQSAEVGLSRWFEAASKYLEVDSHTQGLYDGLVAKRAELSGRLSARRAQAAALAARGPGVDPSLDGKAREAEAALRARPTSLAVSASLVEAYEASIAALTRR